MTSGHAQMGIDDGLSKRLGLKKGPNVIRAAVSRVAAAPTLCTNSGCER
jgi:hypothetical protein